MVAVKLNFEAETLHPMVRAQRAMFIDTPLALHAAVSTDLVALYLLRFPKAECEEQLEQLLTYVRWLLEERKIAPAHRAGMTCLSLQRLQQSPFFTGSALCHGTHSGGES